MLKLKDVFFKDLPTLQQSDFLQNKQTHPKIDGKFCVCVLGVGGHYNGKWILNYFSFFFYESRKITLKSELPEKRGGELDGRD